MLWHFGDSVAMAPDEPLPGQLSYSGYSSSMLGLEM